MAFSKINNNVVYNEDIIHIETQVLYDKDGNVINISTCSPEIIELWV